MAKAAAMCYTLLVNRCICISAKNTGVYRLCHFGIFSKPYDIYTLSKSLISGNRVHFSTIPKSNPPNETASKLAERKKGKSDTGPMVTLVGTDRSISVMSLLEAQKISNRRNLKLVLVKEMDTKTERPEYKLMTTAQYLQEEKEAQEKIRKKSSSIKGEKILNISHKINEHDLNVRIKNISKWISKSYEVRVVINGDSESMGNAEHVYETIAKSVEKEGRIVQKRQKGGDLRFQILPPKKENSGKEASPTLKSESL